MAENVANRTVSLENLYEFKQKIDETVKYKALYNLSTYDSVDASDPDYDVITRNGWKRNVSKWILEHADELSFRDTTNGHEIGKDGGNGAFPSAFVGSGSLMTGVCNQLFEFGSDDAAWANTSGYVFNPNWISLPSSYSTKASYLNFFSTHEIIVDYKLNFSYQETVIKNRPISQLDQDGESWVKSEYEKGLNLFNINAVSNNLLVSHTSTQFKTHLTSTSDFYKYPFKENTAYTFSCDYITEVASSNLRMYFVYSDGSNDIILDGIYSAVSNTKYNSSVTSNPSKTIVSIGITYGSSYGGGSLTIFNPMLVEGPVRKPFVEYSGPSIHAIDVDGVKLWQNGDPNSSFSSNSLSLNDISGYSKLVVAYKDAVGATNAINYKEFKNEAGTFGLFNLLQTYPSSVLGARQFIIDSSTQVTFGSGFNGSSTQDNTLLIPIAIYGIK